MLKMTEKGHMRSQLFYQDTTGYYGLRVQPSLEEMLESSKKHVRIREPHNSAKWDALDLDQNLLNEQPMESDDAQSEDLQDDSANAQQPRAANIGVVLGLYIHNPRKTPRIFNI